MVAAEIPTLFFGHRSASSSCKYRCGRLDRGGASLSIHGHVFSITHPFSCTFITALVSLVTSDNAWAAAIVSIDVLRDFQISHCMVVLLCPVLLTI